MMTNHWDEFSKSLAEESLPRRESLRRIGVVVATTEAVPIESQRRKPLEESASVTSTAIKSRISKLREVGPTSASYGWRKLAAVSCGKRHRCV
jgi:hypothetical protein